MSEKELEVTIQPEMRLGILPARTPHDVIVQATQIAQELSKIVKERKLSNVIQGKAFVRVEGWSTMGAMLGVLPCERPELGKRFDDGSYEATVELLRINDGAIIGRASALVGMDEKDRNGKLTWANRSEYARKSMAITRATGKAFRLGFSWIMTLAGYEATPAEEMIDPIDAEYREVQPQENPSDNGNKAPMTYAEACAIKNSQGILYGDIDSEKLQKMSIGLGKAERTPEQEDKLLAIGIILKERAKEQVPAQ